jgi:hypothetical protein
MYAENGWLGIQKTNIDNTYLYSGRMQFYVKSFKVFYQDKYNMNFKIKLNPI